MPLTVPPKAHRNLASVENVEKRLPVLLAQDAVVPSLLAPHMEVGVGGESVEGCVKSKLEWLWW
jgi:hypothetical protein